MNCLAGLATCPLARLSRPGCTQLDSSEYVVHWKRPPADGEAAAAVSGRRAPGPVEAKTPTPSVLRPKVGHTVRFILEAYKGVLNK